MGDGIAACEKQVKENNKKIAEERNARNNDGQRQLDQEELQRLESKIAEWNTKLVAAEDRVNTLANDISTEVTKDKSLKLKLKEMKDKELKAVQNRINELQQSKNEAFAVYDRNMANALRAIEKSAASFRD